MNNFKPSYSSILWCLLLLLHSCAQIVAPAGGGKDEAPPKVVRMFPQNKTTHFNAPKIMVQFDEFIVLNNPAEQIIISPPLDVKPVYEIDHKKVIIDFKKQKLKPNTTYTINFGNAIGDLHENNLVQNLTYVFCTGDVLDTLFLAGVCSNSFNNKPEKSMLIGLYNAADFNDSTINKQKPIYFSRSKANGSFAIENIPDQPFRVVSFADENNNLKYDANENIAFSSQVLNPGDTTLEPLQLRAYTPDPYPAGKLLDTFSRAAGKFTLVAFKPEKNQMIWSGNTPVFIWKDPAKSHIDTFTFYTQKQDTVLEFKYKTPDTLASLRLNTKRVSKTQPFSFFLKKIPENNDSLSFIFSQPVVSFDTSLIVLKEDTIPVKQYDVIISRDGRNLSMSYPWKESSRYQLIIQDSAFTGLFRQKSAVAFKYNWNTKAQKDYSSLRLNVISKDTGLILLEIWNDQETNLIKSFSIRSGAMVYLDYMLPGTYKVKFIYDSNQNGMWDNGHYKRDIYPENVVYYPENIVLRAYWDIEQVIDLDHLDK